MRKRNTSIDANTSGWLQNLLAKTQYLKSVVFSINQMISKMDKSSRIEFNFASELFKNINITKTKCSLELIYTSIHSSHSIFKTEIFQPIDISFGFDKAVYK
jgi:hypothetical protein